jgi:hypothetical protein
MDEIPLASHRRDSVTAEDRPELPSAGFGVKVRVIHTQTITGAKERREPEIVPVLNRNEN